MDTIERQENKPVTVSDIDIRKRIRTLYLQGHTNKEMQAILGVNENTWESAFYDNRHGFRDFMLELKKVRIIAKAEDFSNRLLSLEDDENPRLLAIQQKEAEFLRETQGKDMGYTKRSEVIGLNINKNEPLDEEQKEKLDKILGQ